MKGRRRWILSIVLLFAFGIAFHGNYALAQLDVNNTASTYTIDFTTTVTGVNNGAWTGTGFQSTTVAGQLDSDAWASTGMDDGALAFGGTRTTGDYARGADVGGGVTTGGYYNFTGGGITTGDTLGIQPGGTDWTPGNLTLRFQNTSGSVISGFDLSYLIYVNNDQARSNSFNFSFSSNDTTYTAVPALDLTSTAALDALGFVSNPKSTTLSSLSIANNAFFYLRWSGDDVGGAGSRDEFALDSIVLNNFTLAPVSTALTWNPTPGGDNDWNTTDTDNWLDGVTPSDFQNGDTANFTDTGVGAVVVDAGGVSPAATNVSNTSGTYSFSGGSINGIGALTKTNAGTLELTSANGYTGGTAINGGTVVVTNDNQLGDAGGGVGLDSGTLRTDAGITSARVVNVAGGGGIINTNGVDSTFSANVAGGGTLTKNGAGILSLTGASLTHSGDVVINGGTLYVPGQYNGPLNISVNSGAMLKLDVSSGIGDATTVQLTSGTFDMNGGFENVGSMALNSGSVINSAGVTAVGLRAVNNSITSTGTSSYGSFVEMSLTSSGTTSVDVSSGKLAVAAAARNSGAGAASLTKIGAGTLEFNGANTYTGVTTVTAGALLVNGSHTGAGNYIVDATGTLGGSGTIDVGANSFTADGTLSPGTSPGPLSIMGSVTLNGTLLAEVADPLSDLLAITGNITLGGASVLELPIANAYNALTTYDLVTFTGSRTGTFFDVNNLPASHTLAYNTNAISLVPIPEPSSLTILGLGLAGLIGAYRRRRG